MSMTGIARYMYFSGSIDLLSSKEREMQLPKTGRLRSVLMEEKQAAVFCADCASRVIRSHSLRSV